MKKILFIIAIKAKLYLHKLKSEKVEKILFS